MQNHNMAERDSSSWRF